MLFYLKKKLFLQHKNREAKLKELYLIHNIVFLPKNSNRNLEVGIIKIPNIFISQGAVGQTLDNRIFSGYMKDPYGKSKILDFKLSHISNGGTKIEFTQKYKDRPEIHFSFKKKIGGIWHGAYKGKDMGEGRSNCVITNIDTMSLLEEF